jgi:hypothetical protein
VSVRAVSSVWVPNERRDVDEAVLRRRAAGQHPGEVLLLGVGVDGERAPAGLGDGEGGVGGDDALAVAGVRADDRGDDALVGVGLDLDRRGREPERLGRRRRRRCEHRQLDVGLEEHRDVGQERGLQHLLGLVAGRELAAAEGPDVGDRRAGGEADDEEQHEDAGAAPGRLVRRVEGLVALVDAAAVAPGLVEEVVAQGVELAAPLDEAGLLVEEGVRRVVAEAGDLSAHGRQLRVDGAP